MTARFWCTAAVVLAAGRLLAQSSSPPSRVVDLEGIWDGTGRSRPVDSDHFVFDIAGFDDYNGIPSSTQKRVHERYWREGDELRITLTVEDVMFLKKPASYTTRWLPAPKGYKLAPFECDAEASRAML